MAVAAVAAVVALAAALRVPAEGVMSHLPKLVGGGSGEESGGEEAVVGFGRGEAEDGLGETVVEEWEEAAAKHTAERRPKNSAAAARRTEAKNAQKEVRGRVGSGLGSISDLRLVGCSGCRLVPLGIKGWEVRGKPRAGRSEASVTEVVAYLPPGLS